MNTPAPHSESVVPHAHGCPVEQIHRVWTTDQGVDPWVLAEETLRFIQAERNRRCTCVGVCKCCQRPIFYNESAGKWAHSESKIAPCETRAEPVTNAPSRETGESS